MVVLLEAGLSYRDIAAHTGHIAMTVLRVWKHWKEEGCLQGRVGTGALNNHSTGWPPSVRMALTDRTASSTGLSLRWSSAMGLALDLSASTVRCRLLRAGLVARMPLRRLPLSREHQRRLRVQWAHELRHWRAEM